MADGRGQRQPAPGVPGASAVRYVRHL